MNSINPNEAPEGYVAIPVPTNTICSECDYQYVSSDCSNIPVSCLAKNRNDKQTVIFVKIGLSSCQP